ncbi:MAG: pyridoxal-phosphate dependent enzyme, partial [Elusimicrobiota bacterium]
VMPEATTTAKKAAVEGYGGTLRPCGPTVGDRMAALDRLIAETGAAFIHSADDPRIIAGAGTVALELNCQVEGLDAIVAPVGGGGLLAGTLLAGHGLRPVLEIYGAEPEMADDAYRSLKKNSLHPARPPRTIADGLRTGLSELTFTILKERAAGILLVSELEILSAMRLLWERAKLLVEPSGAVSLAAVIREKERFKGKRVGVILSGGNVDLTPGNLARLLG